MKGFRWLFPALLLLCAYPALAGCQDYTVIWYQTTDWSDGTQTTKILEIDEYTVCDVSAGSPAPDPSGGGGAPPSTVPPSVSLAFIDTTDPYNPIVGVDASSNDCCDPMAWVILEINGTTQDYIGWQGDGRYQLHFASIPDYADGTQSFDGKACTDSGVCSQDNATMNRFTPSPDIESNTITASWQEEDPEGPMTMQANYDHELRQVYTTTTFSCSEVGENSHYQLKDSLATIAGTDPMPMWNDTVRTDSINSTSYDLSDSASPVTCTAPTQCSSKSGSATGQFGYSVSAHEGVTWFVVDGWTASITNATLDANFQ